MSMIGRVARGSMVGSGGGGGYSAGDSASFSDVTITGAGGLTVSGSGADITMSAGSGQILAQNGSLGAPGFAFTDAATDGIRHGAAAIRVDTSSSQRAKFGADIELNVVPRLLASTRHTQQTFAGTGTINTTGNVVSFTGTSGGTLTLPTATSAYLYFIKDEGGNAGTSNIIIDPPGSVAMDGSASGSITIAKNYGSVIVYSDGSNWFSLAQDIV